MNTTDQTSTPPALAHSTQVGVFKTHTAAENAVMRLQHTGFDMTHLSIVGQDYHTENQVMGFYNTCDRVKLWSKFGAFWGGLWGLLVGAAFLVLPGFKLAIVAEPFAVSLVAAVVGAILFSGLSALATALLSIGIPKNSVLRYDTAIKAGSYLLVAHGTDAELAAMKAELASDGKAQDFTIYAPAATERELAATHA